MIRDNSKRTSTTAKAILGVCIFLLMIGCTAASAKIIYVDADAPWGGSGSSWEDASLFLWAALESASSGDEIRVAEGTYKPGGFMPTPRHSFQLKNGVTVKGGYAGYGEPDPDARSVSGYETILSGYLYTVGENSVNCYHVVTGSGCDETGVLDGFTITAGNANGSDAWDRGGGMYNDGGRPTVINCTFHSNSADEHGGGMYNIDSSPTVTDCTFTRNHAERYGGAMHNDNSSPTVTDCTFSDNLADGGGGMYNYKSSPTLTNCTFSENPAKRYGGAMNNDNSSPTVANCTFSWNVADFGGGMYNYKSSPTLTNCTFTHNDAGLGDGGGMYNFQGSSPTVTNCTFSHNMALQGHGGGISNVYSSPIVTNCTFTHNHTGLGDGGGMFNLYSSQTVTNCTFSGNMAEQGHGGGICNVLNSPTVTNCTFSGNGAGEGGGMYNDYGLAQTVINCIFRGNFAHESGGGMFNLGEVIVTNCTFLGNGHSGMYNDDSNPTVTNCIFWGNSLVETEGRESVSYCNVEGGWPGVGNIDTDPLFVDVSDPEPANWDLHLLPGSPCIDAGNNDAVPAEVTTDLDGNPRIVNSAVDMGAYEFQGAAYIDIGLRVYDGASVIAIACEQGAASSPLRIAKNGAIYGIVLVDPSDGNACGIRIETNSGVKALRRL